MDGQIAGEGDKDAGTVGIIGFSGPDGSYADFEEIHALVGFSDNAVVSGGESARVEGNPDTVLAQESLVVENGESPFGAIDHEGNLESGDLNGPTDLEVPGVEVIDALKKFHGDAELAGHSDEAIAAADSIDLIFGGGNGGEEALHIDLTEEKFGFESGFAPGIADDSFEGSTGLIDSSGFIVKSSEFDEGGKGLGRIGEAFSNLEKEFPCGLGIEKNFSSIAGTVKKNIGKKLALGPALFESGEDLQGRLSLVHIPEGAAKEPGGAGGSASGFDPTKDGDGLIKASSGNMFLGCHAHPSPFLFFEVALDKGVAACQTGSDQSEDDDNGQETGNHGRKSLGAEGLGLASSSPSFEHNLDRSPEKTWVIVR